MAGMCIHYCIISNCPASSVSKRSKANDHVPFEISLCIYTFIQIYKIYTYQYMYVMSAPSANHDGHTLPKWALPKRGPDCFAGPCTARGIQHL